VAAREPLPGTANQTFFRDKSSDAIAIHVSRQGSDEYMTKAILNVLPIITWLEREIKSLKLHSTTYRIVQEPASAADRFLPWFFRLRIILKTSRRQVQDLSQR